MWRWLFNRIHQATRVGDARRRRLRGYCPHLEHLETRDVPSTTLSTLIWTGPSSGSAPWNTAADWTDAVSGAHRVPTSSDDAIIPYDGSTLKNYTVTIASGAMVAHSLSIGATDILLFSGGSLTLSATSVIEPGATLSLSGSVTKTISGATTLVDAGAITQTGLGSLRLGLTTTVNIVAGGLYDLQADSGVTGGTLVNDGTLQKSNVTGTTGTHISKVLSTFNNAAGGTVEAKKGTLVLPGSGTNTGGIFDALTGATLDLTGGGVTATFTGTYQDAGGQGTVQLKSGTLNVGPAGAIFNFSSKTPFQWLGGNIKGGSGASTGLINSGTFDIGSATLSQTEILFGLMINNGTITQSGTNTLTIAAAASLKNQGAYHMQSSANTVINGTGTLVNNGTFNKDGGSSTSPATISAGVNNPGTLEVDVGTLTLSSTVSQLSGTTLTEGTWNVGGAGAAATLNFTLGSSITTIGDSATVALLAPGAKFTKISALAFNYGTFILDGGATFTTTGVLYNAGTISVGTGNTANSGSILTTTEFLEFGTLNIAVGGSPSSKEFGQVVVSGFAALAGTLNVNLANGFSPSKGQTFKIISFGASPITKYFYFSTINDSKFSSNTAAPFTASSTEFDVVG
jgi:hypothetical protein